MCFDKSARHLGTLLGVKLAPNFRAQRFSEIPSPGYVWELLGAALAAKAYQNPLAEVVSCSQTSNGAKIINNIKI